MSATLTCSRSIRVRLNSVLVKRPNIAVNPLYGDYNDDANTDAAFVFQTQDAGIICDDTEVSLSGQTFSGAAFEGIDLIVTTECESTGCHP